MLKLANLMFQLGTFQLQAADFRLSQGDGCWLQGFNGAGKSTFLKCIAGIYPVTAESLSINGLACHDDLVSYKQQVLYISQHCHAYPDFSVMQMLAFCRRFYPLWSQDDVEHLQDLLQLADSKKVRQLSAGMAAKLNLLLAAGSQASLLLLDELIAQVDSPSRHIIAGYLQQRMRDGVAIIYCSHHQDEISCLLKGRALVTEGVVRQERRAEQRAAGGLYATV
jgi:ABC-2 type transport system ATP-binding protein